MRIAIIIGLFVVSGAALAQTPQDPLVGTVAVGYLATNGNTDTSNTNATFKAVWDPHQVWMHTWNAFLISSRSNGIKTADSKAAGYKAQRDFGTHNGYIFGAGDWRQDEFSGYSRQSAEVVGYGRKLIMTDLHTLTVEGGIGRKQSSVIDGTKFDDTIIHGGLDYLLHINENALFTQRLLLELGSDNNYLESVSQLKTTIRGKLSLGASYIIKYNSDVPAFIAKTDRFTAITLEYGF